MILHTFNKKGKYSPEKKIMTFVNNSIYIDHNPIQKYWIYAKESKSTYFVNFCKQLYQEYFMFKYMYVNYFLVVTIYFNPQYRINFLNSMSKNSVPSSLHFVNSLYTLYLDEHFSPAMRIFRVVNGWQSEDVKLEEYGG